MSERYIVHQVFDGRDSVLGSFEVKNGSIFFRSKTDEYNCDMFPPGPMAPMTQYRLTSLLDNPHKSVYLTRG